MSKWIDADVFELHMENEWELGEISNGGWMHFREMLNEEIGIDLVRCRECKHWNEEDHWCNIRDSYGWDYKPDDFCSFGERSSE